MAKKIRLYLILGVLLIPVFSLLRSQDALHRVWAVKDCRIFTMSGTPIEKGTVVIRDGLIESVGVQVNIPKDAEVIDGNTLSLYPGLTDALGQSLLKFPEEKFDISRVYTGQFTDKDRGLTPELKAFDFFEVTKATLEKYHKEGITTVQVIPQRGILTGQAAVFSLGSSDKNADVVLNNTCLGVGFSPSSFLVYPNSLMGAVALIRQEFTDAAYYGLHSSRWRTEMQGIRRPVYQERAEILSDYAAGRKPVVFFCRNQHDIRRALGLARELSLDYFICDLGNESFQVIPELKQARARIICALDFKVPPTSIHAQLGREERERVEKEVYPKNPAKLAEAGIPFVFTSFGTDDPKSYVEGIVKAVENGLPREKALEALTVNSARFLGLEKTLGTVEPGKMANLVLVEGELLTKEAKIRYAFADGNKFEIKEVKAKEGAAPTVNVSGKWELDIEGAGIKVTVDFVQEEALLSGKLTTPFGLFDFSGGTVAGKEIYFEMTLSVGGQDIELYFSGTVEGDKMSGTVIQGTEGSAEFTGRRIPG